MDVGAQIKEYLDSSGISQTFLSGKSGIPLTKLNLALNSKRRLTFDEYERICGALDVNTDRFLTPRKNTERRKP